MRVDSKAGHIFVMENLAAIDALPVDQQDQALIGARWFRPEGRLSAPISAGGRPGGQLCADSFGRSCFVSRDCDESTVVMGSRETFRRANNQSAIHGFRLD